MSNSPLSVRAKIVEVEIYDEDDVDEGRTRHMEVRIGSKEKMMC